MVNTAAVRITVLAILGAVGSVGKSYAQGIEVLTEPRAISVVVVNIEADDLSDDRAVYVDIKGPHDSEFHPLRLFSMDYSEIDGRRFPDPIDGKRHLILPIFLERVKTWENGRHVFEEAGSYSLRLRDVIRGRIGVSLNEGVLYETEVVFAEPSTSDVQYLAIVKSKEFWSRIGVKDEDAESMRKINDTLMGIALIEEIVNSTRHVGDPTHGKSEWADPLYELAFAVPDSSYAPYVAYYAACSYMWKKEASFVKRTYGYELPDRRFAELDYYQKAHKALELAVERGDAYIKPFAMCFLAGMKTWAADFAAADDLIRRVKEEPYTPTQVPDLVDQVEQFTAKLRASAGE